MPPSSKVVNFASFFFKANSDFYNHWISIAKYCSILNRNFVVHAQIIHNFSKIIIYSKYKDFAMSITAYQIAECKRDFTMTNSM